MFKELKRIMSNYKNNLSDKEENMLSKEESTFLFWISERDHYGDYEILEGGERINYLLKAAEAYRKIKGA